MNKKSQVKIIKNALAKMKVKLISYTLKAVIPTGAYENLQPEITVEADTIENAYRFCIEHVEELRSKYSINAPLVVGSQIEIPEGQLRRTSTNPVLENTVGSTETSSSATIPSPAFGKAKQAIDSCLTPEALDLIAQQIIKSVKLNELEKNSLLIIASNKVQEFNGTDK